MSITALNEMYKESQCILCVWWPNHSATDSCWSGCDWKKCALFLWYNL